eukprot:gene13951-16489_t
MTEAPISHIPNTEEEEEVEGNVENHTPDEEPTEEEKLAMLQEFISRTGSDDATAESFLEAHEYVLANGIADYLSQVEGHDVNADDDEGHDVNADDDEGQDMNADGAQEDPRSESVKRAEGVPFQDLSDISKTMEVSNDLQMPTERNLGAEGTAKLVVQADTEVSQINSEEQALGDIDSEDAAITSPDLAPDLDSDLQTIPLTDGALSAGRSPGDEEIDEVAERIRREVAELASEAGREAREAISGIGHKVLEGLGSLGAGSSTEGGGGLKEFGSKLSSWWSNRGPSTGKMREATLGGQRHVDYPAAVPPRAGPGLEKQSCVRRVLRDELHLMQEASMEHVRRLFPEVGEGEELIQSFPCKLTQTYQCSHNKYTPDIQ